MVKRNKFSNRDEFNCDCPKPKVMTYAGCCGADIYKKIFGPTLDESLIVLLLAILDLMERWKKSVDIDGEEINEETCNEEWDDSNDTSGSAETSTMICEKECCKPDNKRKKKSAHCC